MDLAHSFRNLLWGRPSKENAIIVPLYRAATGEYQVESIGDAINAYLHDSDIYNAVNFICNSALSDGFYITGNEEHKNGKALDLVKEFNDTIRWGNRRSEKRLAPLLRIITHELVYGGNTFIEMLTPQKLDMLNQVQLSSIYRIFRNPQGDVNKIQQLIGGRLNDLDPNTIIHIPWLQIDREPFGRGLIQPLIAPRLDTKGRQIPPFYRIKASLEYDLYRMVHRRGVPRSIFSFPEAGDELIDSYTKELQDPDIDASFATNMPVNISSEQGGPAQGAGKLVDWLSDRYQLGLQTPINALITASGFTEACMDSETLTLTENGWKHYWEIGANEKIATFNPESDKIEFHVPDAIHVYEHDGDMIHFKSAKQDILVTSNHQMYYRTRYWNRAPASQVANIDQVYFRTSAEFEEERKPVEQFTIPGQTGNGMRRAQALALQVKSEPWLRLVGYYISEGALRDRTHYVSITQKKEPTVSHIRSTLNELNIPYHEYFDRRFSAIEFQLKGGKRLAEALKECGFHANEKRIPRKYMELPKAQLRVLLEALIEGDGSKDSRPNRITYEYFTTSEGLANDVLELAWRAGYSAYIYRSQDRRPAHKRHPIFRVAIYTDSRRETKLSRGFAKTEHYHGAVYCFTVKNHLFVTMRNGKPTIQGNSARVAEELGRLVVEDLQLRLKYAIEDELYDRILVQNGFDPKQAAIEFHWGKGTDYEYNVTDVLNTFDRSLLSISEGRKMLRKIGMELDDDSKFFEEVEKAKTATTAKSQQVVVGTNPAPEPQIQSELQPQTQAKTQGLIAGQTAKFDPNA